MNDYTEHDSVDFDEWWTVTVVTPKTPFSSTLSFDTATQFERFMAAHGHSVVAVSTPGDYRIPDDVPGWESNDAHDH